jgi:adenylyltransferase/sulfurtransferase
MDKYLLSERYSRQAGLPSIGQTGQRILEKSRLIVIGAGGLASPLLLALAGSGAGHITVVDHDNITMSNLNRQFLYRYKDIGRSKARLAVKRLQDYRPDLSVKAIVRQLDEKNASEIISGYDVVVSAVDNLHTRYIINQAACRAGVLLSNAAVNSFGGYAMLVEPGSSACYECFQGPEHTCQNEIPDKARTEGLVLGTVATVVGALQADMITGHLLGTGVVQAGTVVIYDGRRQSLQHINVKKAENCRTCSMIDPAIVQERGSRVGL